MVAKATRKKKDVLKVGFVTGYVYKDRIGLYGDALPSIVAAVGENDCYPGDVYDVYEVKFVGKYKVKEPSVEKVA